ncbi:hypothetical protein FHS19_001653 [Paenibacillus rhizosphaerae]|uniref:Uncharacterized protein n=1 Tax=Paenibacillus rhizosphaerae TaxID=297318 RepID=A0A839TNR1_9BACL|nr:hypothetical protein [Paenibacillus rhizosphaerae]MBB3126999.1 hypothetical protein [Paenibacillus rhizosphaerae]
MDRADKNRWLIAAITLQGIMVIILFISLETVLRQSWWVYTAGFLLMIFGDWAEPGRRTAALVDNIIVFLAHCASGVMVTIIIL